MDKTDREQVLTAFVRVIDHLADKEYQKRAWIKGEEADFDETCCIFFGLGDSIIEDYKDFEITEKQCKMLKKFRDQFRAFSDENDLPQEFIDTPEWANIIDSAKRVLQAFNYKEK